MFNRKHFLFQKSMFEVLAADSLRSENESSSRRSGIFGIRKPEFFQLATLQFCTTSTEAVVIYKIGI